MSNAVQIVVGYLFAVLVVAPVATLLHELAHAVGAVGVPVTVRVGADPPLLRFRVGRIVFRLNPWRGWIGTVERTEGASRPVSIVAIAAGPVASLVVAAGLFVGAEQLSGPPQLLAWSAAWWVLLAFLFTAVPLRYPSWFGFYAGMASDGRRIVCALRSSRPE